MNSSIHRAVLLNETIEGLDLQNKSVVLDATFGGGGHSREILEKYPNVKIIALDQDKNTWEQAKDKFKGFEKRIFFKNVNFRDLDKIYQKENSKDFCAFVLGVKKARNPRRFKSFNFLFDAIIFDLGLSSDQLENSGRGFSFMKDEPLIMTMKENPLPEDLTAKYIVNNWSEESLADIIYGYGEERFGRKIARGIVEARKKNKIETTFDLVQIVESSVPTFYKKGRLHFATRTFQALRIAVNDALRTFQTGLEKGFKVLNKNGRMVVITFHSLEDRIAKRFYKGKEKNKEAILINKKPIITSKEEIINNPRARSAKLRILEKI